MRMSTKASNRLLKHSIVLLTVMTGEEKMYYLERMWDLYIDVYTTPKFRKKLSRTYEMDKLKAYDLCSKLTKIFGH
jgi:hypothetical protein